MTSVIGILVLAALFLVFPLISRESSGGCSGQGCWKEKAGFGCRGCPKERSSTPPEH